MADKSSIIDAIEALAVHCRPPLMSTDQRELWMRDWCADLGEFPLEAVQRACRSYRHSGATKFPTAGQFLPLVKSHLPTQQGERINEVWRPLDEDAYRALTVREKIRHHLIMAHEAAIKAGPMWRNQQGASITKARACHLTAEEMPAEWRHWNAQAANHTAKAQRLRGHLHLPAVQRA